MVLIVFQTVTRGCVSRGKGKWGKFEPFFGKCAILYAMTLQNSPDFSRLFDENLKILSFIAQK